MLVANRPALNTAQFFNKLSTVMTAKGQVDGKTMQEGLSQLGQNADVDQLKGLLAANGAGQLDPAAQTALMNFVHQAQLGSVPDAATVRGFSLQLQSKLQNSNTRAENVATETRQAFSAVGALADKAGPADVKRALKELAEAEGAATAALAAAAAAEKAASVVLQPSVGGPALDVHVASATENLAKAAASIDEVKGLVAKAMGGKPISRPALFEALETLQSAINSVDSFRAIADSVAARM